MNEIDKTTAKVTVVKKEPKDFERCYVGEKGDPDRLTENEVRLALSGLVQRVAVTIVILKNNPGKWYRLSNFAKYRYNPEGGSDE